jgi:chemotaxis response regulator CheB
LTIAQDEETSVIFGTPREQIRRGSVRHFLPLAGISRLIEHHGDHMALSGVVSPVAAVSA